MFNRVKQYVNKVLYPNTYSNDRFCEYIREHGGVVGSNVNFVNPKATHVDINRAKYISIGDNCCLSAVSLIAHDYSWYVLGYSDSEIYPDGGGGIRIGNNCFIGYKSIVLRNVTIGENVIIGAGSVVTKDIPSNTVWGGSPAKQLMTLDEYKTKRKKNIIREGKMARDVFIESNGREMTIEECAFFGFYFLQRTEENYVKYIARLPFNSERSNSEQVRFCFFNSKPLFDSYENYISALKEDANEQKK
ncbi:acyltransferase [Enterocloster lavalensis]|uniref:acyltransferase n=1 Tax=Enterocloster lavalensis TaxID=460384 RepID=UPI00266623E2|nr:acyltransferase [Enterocloster lavalensis]